MASLLLLVSVVASLCVTAAAQGDKILRPALASCSTTGNYTDGSQFKKNLDELLAALPAEAGANGWFYNGTAVVIPSHDPNVTFSFTFLH
jgi:hypothetical protein